MGGGGEDVEDGALHLGEVEVVVEELGLEFLASEQGGVEGGLALDLGGEALLLVGPSAAGACFGEVGPEFDEEGIGGEGGGEVAVSDGVVGDAAEGLGLVAALEEGLGGGVGRGRIIAGRAQQTGRAQPTQ